MAAKKLYKDYFAIDPKYFPQVTEALIKKGEVSWKNYYASDSFIQLISQTCDMINGKNPLSLFTWGPYGSGKSHLLLTLISMLKADDQEVTEYFEEQKLSKDLMNKFISAKNSGKIITIHRIGSANISNETDLVLAVQQSVMNALKENGIENQGEASMKDSFLQYISKASSRNYFSALIQEEQYAFDFAGKTIDDVEKIVNGEDIKASEEMMRKVMKVLKDNGQYGILKDSDAMSDWIKDIIEKNNIKAVIFAWDEFSEFLINHPTGLTGIQTLLEISNSHPFYFIIVTHEAQKIFEDKNAASKFLDRFQKPIEISLPENTAFKLLHNAMKITSDPVDNKEWLTKILPAINGELADARKHILSVVRTAGGKKSAFSDEDLKSVAPIHPYAALILRQIASMFNSNQRSMFDFVISDQEDTKGFKWFINKYSPFNSDNTHILTVDMLWDFFCGKQVTGLSDDVRGIFLSYDGLKLDKLTPDEQRVIKTILILQAVSVRISNDDLLAPNNQTLDLSFSGEWSKNKAISIAKGLVEKKLVFEKPMANGKKEYCVASGNVYSDNIDEYKNQAIAETKTSSLIISADLVNAVPCPKSVEMRYKIETTSDSGFSSALNTQIRHIYRERIKTIITFASNDTEAQHLRQQILNSVKLPNNEIMFIETLTPLGKDLYDQYIDALAFSKYFFKKDKDQSAHYQGQAEAVLRQWSQNIANGAFMVFTPENPNGERKANLSDLQDFLRQYDIQKYPYCLEQYNLNATLYGAFNLAQGAELGIKGEIKGAYKTSNKNISIENALEGAWGVKKYWEDNSKQSLVIVKVKRKIEEVIAESFKNNNGEVSILSLFDEMAKPPFGFMPNSITALVMGFCLSEYSVPEYFWSNHSDNEIMSIDKMKGMIANALNQRTNETKNYKEEFIVTMTARTRKFLEVSSAVFGIPSSLCVSIPDTRNLVRIKMKSFQFPIWCVKSLFDKETFTNSRELVEDIIDCYIGIANTANSVQGTENSLAEKIGEICINNPTIVDDLKTVVVDNKCRDGMIAYIGSYKNGELCQLAADIDDNGEYIEVVSRKFNASDDSNWVWNKQTAEDEISNVILEYKIIKESRKSLSSSCHTLSEVVSEWNRRTNNIKIPCEIAAKQVGDLGSFLWQLNAVKRNNAISEQDKQKFYDLLCVQREPFDAFYKNQLPYFIADAKSLLDDLEEVEIAEVFNNFSAGQFTKSKNDYYNYVNQEINNYVLNQWKKKMQKIWLEKTGTKDPVDWSERNLTPIICMVDENKRGIARKMFDIIKSVSPTEDDAKAAIDFMEKADFFDRLGNQEERDKRFMDVIVGSNAVLLDDVNDIRNKLRSKVVHEPPYYWYGSGDVQKTLNEMADKEYKLKGSQKANQIIDNMNPEQLREYLKRRIADDVDFGIQILKGEVDK